MAMPCPETRVAVDLELRVWGMGADGRVFSQHARARNVSSGGALLSGIEHDLKIGDTIGVQQCEKKARCKVVWTRNTDSIQKIQVGVQLLSKHECPWAALLPKAEGAASTSPQSRRRWERHKISVVIALHDERGTTPMRVTATDISAGGCYVETIFPLSIGTSLKVDLWIAEEKITTLTFVRTSDPGLGMGIEFIGLKPEDQQRLQEYLKAMNPWGCSIKHQNPGPRTA
jgi:PilZ domain-containing protein